MGSNPARASRIGSDDAPFRARIQARRISSYDVLSVQAPSHWMELRARDGSASNSYFILYFMGCATIGTRRGAMDIPASGLAVINPQRHETLQSTQEINYRSLRIPRHLLDSHIAPRHWPNNVIPLQPDRPIGALISAYAGTLLADGPSLDDSHADTVMESLCRLIALGIKDDDPRQGSHQQAVRAARLARVKRVIQPWLADPELSPAAAAAKLKMSTRTLHLLFRDSGDTFSGHVMRCRLDACRAALTDPAQIERSVADIAFGWGFSNLTTFYRAFRTAFDMTPLEMRSQADGLTGARDTP
jgi:AraC-like DNA-binding protein